MKKTIISLTFLILTYSLLQTVSAQETVCIDFFYGKTCPHCTQEKVFLEGLKQKYNIKINKFEVTENRTNARLFEKLVEAYNVSPDVSRFLIVPTTFIGDRAFVGFAEGDSEIFNPKYQAYVGYSGLIEKTIQEYAEEGSVCLSGDIEPENDSPNSDWIVKVLIVGFILFVIILLKTKILRIKV